MCDLFVWSQIAPLKCTLAVQTGSDTACLTSDYAARSTHNWGGERVCGKIWTCAFNSNYRCLFFCKMWPSLFLFPFGDGVLYLNAHHIQSPRSPVSLTSTFNTALRIHPPSLSMNNWGLPVEILQSEAEGGGGAQWLQGTGRQLNN